MKILSILLLLFIAQSTNCQTFLEAYKEFEIAKIKSEKNSKWRKKRLTFLTNRILQLDTIFNSYKSRSGFDFNTADSLKIIYQTGVETGLSDFIIWSNKDTISYGELWLVDPLTPSLKKIIEYKPFLDITWHEGDFILVTERDSLMALVSKNDFTTAEKLSKENPVFDGARSRIITFKKINDKGIIKELLLTPFGIRPIWRSK